MNIDTIEVAIKEDDVIFACPHCLVCSSKLSAAEYEAVQTGQQMIDVCQVCGKEVVFNG